MVFKYIALKLKSKRNGGGDRDRTGDLDVANVALSQLSYTPGDNENSKFEYLNAKQILLILLNKRSKIYSGMVCRMSGVKHNGVLE